MIDLFIEKGILFLRMLFFYGINDTIVAFKNFKTVFVIEMILVIENFLIYAVIREVGC
ncbi:hypothetical protein P278_10640 [Zhouia amylolytica AD3]|uniref:Uncharacterized protein n=1 Tax=Zhouia amylolytica AD3 TaxID=1286632 RepID=W2UPW4_9FLAO|nr:hypothetical protein P278_10640 [Zhouia amylolytica AD3]